MKELIVNNNPKSPITEAYKSLRTNIQFANVDGDVKTLIFTSATSSEGKTTTLSNVALTLADLGYKVLVMDCDLRKPRIHRVFEISNAEGLTDMLLSGKDYRSYLAKDLYSNLDVLPSGKIPTNPSEILSSEKMKNFTEKLKEDYDYILIDTPPLLPVTDAAIVASYIDGVILVCASGVIEIEGAKKAKDSLEKVKANVLGVVLNKVPIKGQKYSNYYYYANGKDE